MGYGQKGALAIDCCAFSVLKQLIASYERRDEESVTT